MHGAPWSIMRPPAMRRRKWCRGRRFGLGLPARARAARTGCAATGGSGSEGGVAGGRGVPDQAAFLVACAAEARAPLIGLGAAQGTQVSQVGLHGHSLLALVRLHRTSSSDSSPASAIPSSRSSSDSLSFMFMRSACCCRRAMAASWPAGSVGGSWRSAEAPRAVATRVSMAPRGLTIAAPPLQTWLSARAGAEAP